MKFIEREICAKINVETLDKCCGLNGCKKPITKRVDFRTRGFIFGYFYCCDECAEKFRKNELVY